MSSQVLQRALVPKVYTGEILDNDEVIRLRYSDYVEDDQLGKDAGYLVALHYLSCCVCDAFGLIQTSPTDAHHVICGRFGERKTPDRMAIPLCKCHHQGLRGDRDKSKLAIHKGKESWVAAYGPDYDYIAQTQDRVERLDMGL